MRTFTVTVKGEEIAFASALSDEDAIDRLKNLPNPSEFGKSLLQRKKLSERQMAWVHKIAADASRPKPVVEGDFSSIYELLSGARAKLKAPKVSFVCISMRYVGGEVIVRALGSYVGKILRDGSIECSAAMTQGIAGELRRIAGDCSAAIAEFARATGTCCFCALPLKDDKSTRRGCGPTCAKNYRIA